MNYSFPLKFFSLFLILAVALPTFNANEKESKSFFQNLKENTKKGSKNLLKNLQGGANFILENLAKIWQKSKNSLSFFWENKIKGGETKIFFLKEEFRKEKEETKKDISKIKEFILMKIKNFLNHLKNKY